MNKDLLRQKHATIIIIMVVCLALASVGLALLGKLTADYNLTLGTLLAYAGNHTFQNYRTSPKNNE